MKAPDLANVEAAAVRSWRGAVEPLRAASARARLTFTTCELGQAKDRAAVFTELDRKLHLPEHFGHNWDALADVLEDRDWLGKSGRVIVLAGVATYRKDHPNDWSTLEDILAEAVEFWKELHVPFWVFTT